MFHITIWYIFWEAESGVYIFKAPLAPKFVISKQRCPRVFQRLAELSGAGWGPRSLDSTENRALCSGTLTVVFSLHRAGPRVKT